MRKKIIHDISANTLQAGINQLCGFVIFYILSISLDKDHFGEINWSLAVLLTSFGILACGIDQVALKRIASGNDAQPVLAAFIMHVLIAGIIFYLSLLLSYFLFPHFHQQHNLLLLLGIAKLMIFFSTPFKQLATGLGKFRPLLIMSICSNLVRSIALLVLSAFGNTDLSTIIFIFIIGDLSELILCIFITIKVIKIPVRLQWNKKNYTGLFRESIPQLGVAVITSIIARFDWIFLGIFTSSIILADYSFAYKVFEMSTLPLLVIAPVLISRFAKLFHPAAAKLSVDKTAGIIMLLKMEMLIASFTAMVLNILWVPVIDLITHGKYGFVNRQTILILSACMPFLYLNNFLWTINFSKGRLKMIFYVFLFTLLANLAGDIILIPFFKGEGAAIGYLLAMITQSFLYFRQTNIDGLKKNSYCIILFPCFAAISGYCAYWLLPNSFLALITATIFYFLLLIVTKQLRYEDWLSLKRITGSQGQPVQ
ncbi:MAG: oligosaccharide flippase family protein [Ferruginibacter sp.]